uniref:Uncharacterized protein n=1 Tax=Manihot esculenta TaxID=3983 RepID=A0A2C9UPT3_MANES
MQQPSASTSSTAPSVLVPFEAIAAPSNALSIAVSIASQPITSSVSTLLRAVSPIAKLSLLNLNWSKSI